MCLSLCAWKCESVRANMPITALWITTIKTTIATASRFGLRSLHAAITTTTTTTATNTQNAAHLTGLAATTITTTHRTGKDIAAIHKQFRLCQLQAARLPQQPPLSHSSAVTHSLCSLSVLSAGLLQHCPTVALPA